MDQGDYVAVLALIVSLGSLVFSWRSAEQAKVAAAQPVLVFHFGSDGWELQNLGTGPAMNVLVLKGGSRRGWTFPVRVPPLSKDGSVRLHWDPLNNTDGLAAQYEDVLGNLYSTQCGNDLNTIRAGQRLGDWKEVEIKRAWALPEYKD